VVIFKVESSFMSGPTWIESFPFGPLHIVGMTGTYYHALPLVEMESQELFVQVALAHDPPNLHSQVARITGMSQHTHMSSNFSIC
jgi:hypothetical protein